MHWDWHSHKSGKLLETTEELTCYKKFLSKAKDKTKPVDKKPI